MPPNRFINMAIFLDKLIDYYSNIYKLAKINIEN